MDLKRRDLLLAAGLTLVFGRVGFAVPLYEGGPAPRDPNSKPRRLALYNAHTGERFSGLYRDDVGPIPSAMTDLAYLLRDHHENVIGPLYVETLDFLADVLDRSGAERATVLSGYRTKKTNEMLATKLFGVAEKSQHIVGRAIDITFDGRLADAAAGARAMHRGGVGWYPHSHFIHIDSGPVRNWTFESHGLDRLLIAGGGRRRGRHVLTSDAKGAPKVDDNHKGPLTVKERIALQRALAKRQFRRRNR
ncbi:MAG: DUF882 domain-containing protein [Alphaproteobacteria bacterium]|nr:DUF882 domain-containing protein [Alphaproteobacteria bacterium]